MKSRIGLVTALSAVVAAGPALAQDSISKTSCLPGDALSPYADATATFGSEQEKSYVLDLAPISGSWGTPLGIGPLSKSSKLSSAFLGSLISAQGMSQMQSRGVPFFRDGYDLWTTPGAGVHPDPALNDPGSTVDTSSFVGHQFAAAYAEFATAELGASYNGVIGHVVNIDPADAGRLYVTRTVGAINGCDGSANGAQFGFGGIEESGVLSLRADCFGCATGCATDTTGNNYWQVDLGSRDPSVINVVSDNTDFFLATGDFDTGACEPHVVGYGGTLVTPTVMSGSLSGGDPWNVGTDFDDNFVRTTSLGGAVIDSTQMALPAFESRGNVSWSSYTFPVLESGGDAIATLGSLANDSGFATSVVTLWGMDAAGAVTGVLNLSLPSAITDDSVTDLVPPLPAYSNLGPGTNEFANDTSQTPFRGGNGQVAIGRDNCGNLLMAAAVDQPVASDTSPTQYIAVARVDPDTGSEEWTMAGYIDVAGGKPILDGPAGVGSEIGQLIDRFTVVGALPTGPSMSSPMIDGFGNVWFLSFIEIYGATPEDPSDFGVGLIRAVYDPVDFDYDLELIFEGGDITRGLNSDRDYLIGFISITDSNSIGSSTAFSGNMSETSHLGQSVANMAGSDPETLGGMVVSVELVYDWNDDGTIDSCDPSAKDPGDDQDYNVLLYVGATTDGADLDSNGINDSSQKFWADTTTIDLSAGGSALFELQSEIETAGDLHWIVGSATGTAPGFPAGPFLVPLVFDSYTLLTITSPIVLNSINVLNKNAYSFALLSLPPASDPTLAGITLHHAYVTVDFSGPFGVASGVSNPWSVTFVP